MSEFTITQRGIKPTLSEIVKINGEKPVIQFVCKECDSIVKPEEILGHCFNCGKASPLNELYKIVKHSGFYCESCSVNFIGEEYSKKPISTLLKFYSGNGGNNE